MSEHCSGDEKILNDRETDPDRRGGSRRVHQRFHVKIDTILECGNIAYKGAIIDISKKGCRVITDNEIHKATNQVSLKYTFPGEQDTRIVRGKIKWTEHKDYVFLTGIEFLKPQNF